MKKWNKRIIMLVSLIFFTCVSYAQESTIMAFVNYWIGVPYRYGGTDMKGIDCSGFTQRFYKEVFLKDIPRTAKTQFRALTKITKDCLQPGDLIFFSSKGSPSGWHVGVYLQDNSFIHAANKRLGVVISKLDNYSQTIIGYCR
jgi:probable lipoprotein NlpC